MSGYIGNPDAEAEHALILAENGVEAHREQLRGKVYSHCLDCGEEIPAARIQAAIKMKIRCEYCIHCQSDHDKVKKRKMLDRIL